MTNPVFTEEKHFSRSFKETVYADWCQFIQSGFDQPYLSRSLWQFLVAQCQFPAIISPAAFWAHYFDRTYVELVRFINQFGKADHPGATLGHDSWLQLGQAADLKAAMCAAMARHYPTLIQVLTWVSRRLYEAERDRDTAQMVGLTLQDNPELAGQESQLMQEYQARYEQMLPYDQVIWSFASEADLRRLLAEAMAIRAEAQPAAEAKPVNQPALFELFQNAPQTAESAPADQLPNHQQAGDPYFAALRDRLKREAHPQTTRGGETHARRQDGLST
jgi:hypothetical protein